MPLNAASRASSAPARKAVHVELPSGTFAIGPDTGALTLHTRRTGVGAIAGHDLAIEVTRWEGTLRIDPADIESSSVTVTIDATSLEVREGTGSPVPLLAVNKADIVRTISRLLQTKRHREIRFVSTDVSATDGGYVVRGDLTVAGANRAVDLTVTVDGSSDAPRGTITTTVLHSDFGIKPYSAMLGALRVRDAVDVRAEVCIA